MRVLNALVITDAVCVLGESPILPLINPPEKISSNCSQLFVQRIVIS